MLLQHLNSGDVLDAVRLSDQAGWNQTEDDWAYMLANGMAEGFRTKTGTLVASALLIPVRGNLHWISMVLVDETFRRRGLATRLITSILKKADKKKLITGLDATSAGRPLYRSLGFADQYPIARWRRASGKDVLSKKGSRRMPGSDQSNQTKRPSIFPTAQFEDTNWAGVYPTGLFKYLQTRLSAAFRTVEDNRGNLAGISAGRTGRTGIQIGPVFARDLKTFEQLLLPILDFEMPLIVDVPAAIPERNDLMLSLGFKIERSFTRMTRGNREPILPNWDLFAIAGPELG